jgi:hypothetical protein
MSRYCVPAGTEALSAIQWRLIRGLQNGPTHSVSDGSLQYKMADDQKWDEFNCLRRGK